MINPETAKSELPSLTQPEVEALTDPALAKAMLEVRADYQFTAVISSAHLHKGNDALAREFAAETQRLVDSFQLLADEHMFRGTARRAINELNADLKRALS